MPTPKNVIEMATEIASEANKCCTRSDGYEEAIYELALKYLQQAYEWGEDSIRNSNCYHQPEDMGR